LKNELGGSVEIQDKPLKNSLKEEERKNGLRKLKQKRFSVIDKVEIFLKKTT